MWKAIRILTLMWNAIGMAMIIASLITTGLTVGMNYVQGIAVFLEPNVTIATIAVFLWFFSVVYMGYLVYRFFRNYTRVLRTEAMISKAKATRTRNLTASSSDVM